MGKVKRLLQILISVSIIFIVTSGYTYLVYITDSYPQGNDVYGHLFKIQELYDSLKSGVWYPVFSKSWYNGIETFRYWPPISYYFYALLMYIVQGNIRLAFVLFIFVTSFISGCGFILFGLREKRLVLATCIGSIFFMLPDNMRVFHAEGNIPRIFITMLLPYIFFLVCEYLKYGKKYAIILLTPLIVLVVFSHIMIAAMLGISIGIYTLVHMYTSKQLKRPFLLITDMVIAYLCSGIILIPGLIGGIVTQNSEASQNTSGAMWSSKLLSSLNPINRFMPEGTQIFYFGISLFIILILGVIVKNKNIAPGFLTAFIILVGTTTIVLPILSALPVSQVFWMIRFIPMAEVVLFIGVIYWKELKKGILVILMFLIIIDSGFSFVFIQKNNEVLENERKIQEDYLFDEACSITDSRLANMDLTMLGSYPTYRILEYDIDYLFGWAYQGAHTIEEIVQLNEAFEKGYYVYVFDRLIEYGCDTVLVKKDEMHTEQSLLIDKAEELGYHLYDESEKALLFKYDINTQYGTIRDVKNVCIGSGSDYISFLYPSFYKLKKNVLDEYTYEELKDYEKIYMSGFIYRDKVYCESLVQRLAAHGVKLYIDMANVQQEPSKGKNSFMGITAEDIIFKESLPILEKKNGSQFRLNHGIEDWHTYYLDNLKYNVRKYEYTKGRFFPYLGTDETGQITYMSFNLVYNMASHLPTEEVKLYDFLDEIFEEDHDTPAKIELYPITAELINNKIIITSDYDNIHTNISNLDCFKSVNDLGNNLFITVNKGTTEIDIVYAELNKGLLCSVFGGLLFIVFIITIMLMEDEVINDEKENTTS